MTFFLIPNLAPFLDFFCYCLGLFENDDVQTTSGILLYLQNKAVSILDTDTGHLEYGSDLGICVNNCHCDCSV